MRKDMTMEEVVALVEMNLSAEIAIDGKEWTIYKNKIDDCPKDKFGKFVLSGAKRDTYNDYITKMTLVNCWEMATINETEPYGIVKILATLLNKREFNLKVTEE